MCQRAQGFHRQTHSQEMQSQFQQMMDLKAVQKAKLLHCKSQRTNTKVQVPVAAMLTVHFLE